MRKTINKHWNVLQINPGLRETFQNNPIVAFKRNKNLQEIIGGHTIKNGKVFKANSKNRKEKRQSCNKSKSSRCCKQVIDTSTFRSYQTQQLYTIFHKLNCKSKFIIYFMEYASCKVQYVRKAETASKQSQETCKQSKIYPNRFAFQKTWLLIQSACKIHIN